MCTGNYYRSRFSEILFNKLAGDYGVALRAESRGLVTSLITEDMGCLSPHAIRGLEKRHIPFQSYLRRPIQVQEKDLAAANMVVALDEREHRPLVEKMHPRWADRISYWQVADIQDVPPDIALDKLERNVRLLLARPITCSSLKGN